MNVYRWLRFIFLWLIVFVTGCAFSFESPPEIREIATADLDGNGMPDFVVASGRFGEPYSYPTEIYYQIIYNDGAFPLTRTGILPDVYNHNFISAEDLNGDGFPDAILGSGAPQVYLNDGAGGMIRGSRLATHVMLSGFEGGSDLGDLNGDGAVDIFIANCCGGVAHDGLKRTLLPSHNLVFLNDGRGRFTETGQPIGASGSNDVALGDLDGDGDLDAFVVNGQTTLDAESNMAKEVPNRVWLNDGNGRFTDSGQLLGRRESRTVTLADINGDGFLDAIVGNNGPDALWLNDGVGNFTDGGQPFPDQQTEFLFFADFDNDGDPDLLLVGERRGAVWWNDGRGGFTADSQRFSLPERSATTVADIDADGDIDIINVAVNDYTLWLNDGRGQWQQQ